MTTWIEALLVLGAMLASGFGVGYSFGRSKGRREATERYYDKPAREIEALRRITS